MKRYHYHCNLAGGDSEEPIQSSAYFKSYAIFLALLSKWSGRGWTYFETAVDRNLNREARNVWSYKQCDVLQQHAKYWRGTDAHSVVYVRDVKYYKHK